MRQRIAFLLCVAVGLTGCATAPKDYSAFAASAPKSILILPPVNQSVDLSGTYGPLSTMSSPIAEMGYYVFPVEVVDRLLKENGFTQSAEMHQIPLDKLRAVTGADAVLYPTVSEYGSKYQLIASTTKVHMSARLVDARTGTTLWENKVALEKGATGSNQIGLLGKLVEVAIAQLANSVSDPSRQLAAEANVQLFTDKKTGLLVGPYRKQQ